VSTAVPTAGQTKTEPEVSDLGEYQQWRASRSRIAADRLFNAHFQSFVVP